MFPRIHLHVGDYLQRTRHLRAAQQGAFFSLVLHYWANGKVRQEDEQLATIASMTMREWKKHKLVIQKMFEPGWRLLWLEATLKDAIAVRGRRSKAGQSGNDKRWGKNKHIHADHHLFGFGSRDDRNAIARGSLPQATCHSEEPGQERTDSEEEGDVVESGLIPRCRERA